MVLGEAEDDTHVYVDTVPDAISQQFQLVQGVPRAIGWPAEVVLDYSRSQPDGIVLTDHIENAHGWLIASPRLQSVLEAVDAPVEFLPVQLRSHKGVITASEYAIVNFISLTEAIDREQSEFEEDAAEPEQIYSFESMVLRSDIIEAGPAAIRLRENSMTVLFRADVVDAIKEQGLTGMELVPTDEYESW